MHPSALTEEKRTDCLEGASVSVTAGVAAAANGRELILTGDRFSRQFYTLRFRRLRECGLTPPLLSSFARTPTTSR